MLRKPRSRKLYKGTRLAPSGIHTDGYFQDFDFTNAMEAPVKWHGEAGQLYFWNWADDPPINVQASDMIIHPGFYIRGTAIVVTAIETWYCWGELPGNEQAVKAKFSHLGFKGQYLVLPSARDDYRQNLYNDNPDDFVLMKLAI